MDLRIFKYNFALRIFTLVTLIFTSSKSFAVSDFLSSQSPQFLMSLVYVLIGMMLILLAVPIALIYFNAAKVKKHEQERNEHCRILDLFNTGAIYVDNDGKVIYSNRTANKLFGQSAQGMYNHYFANFIDKDSVDNVKKGLFSKPSFIDAKIKNNEKVISIYFGESLQLGKHSSRILTIRETDSLNLMEANSASSAPQDAAMNQTPATQDVNIGLDELANKQINDLLTLSPVAIGTLNGDHEITSANPVMIERLKYDEKELKKGNIYKLFFDPEEAGTTAKHLNTRQELNDFHVKLKGKDGKVYPGELTVKCVDEDNQQFLFWIINRSDEQFQHDKFESLLQHSKMPMAILTNDGFSKVNEAACAFFNVEDEKQLLGVYPHSTKLNKGINQANELASLLNDVKSQNEVKHLTWTHVINEQDVPCKITFIPIFKDNAFDSILCTWHDLSALYKAEVAAQEVFSKQEKLQSSLTEAQDMLTQSQRTLKEKTALIDRLETELDQVQNQAETLESSLSELKAQAGKSDESRQQLEQELKEHKDKAQSLIEEHQKTQQIIDALNHEKSQFAAQAEQARMHAEEIKKEQQQTLERLTAEKEETIGQLEQEKQSLSEQLTHLQEELEDKQSAWSSAEDKIVALKQSYEDELSQLRSETDTQREEIEQQIRADFEARIQNVTEQAESEKARIKDEQASLEIKISELNSALEAKSEALESLNQTLDEKDSQLSAKEQNLSELQQQLEQSREQLEELHEQLDKERRTAQESIGQQQTLIEQEDELKAELEEKTQLINDLQIQLEAIASASEQEKAAISQEQAEKASAQKAELESALESAQKENQSLQEKLNEYESSVKKADAKLQQHQSEQAQLESAIAHVRQQVARLEENLADTQREKESLSEKLSASEQQANEKLTSLKAQLDEAKKAQAASKEEKVPVIERGIDMQKQAKEQAAAASPTHRPDIEKLPLPNRPELWFDIKSYLATQGAVTTLTSSLLSLMKEIEDYIKHEEAMIDANNTAGIIESSKQLLGLAKKINSVPLLELVESLNKDCKEGMIDNVTIRWPATKLALQRSLRAIYQQLKI
uniref:PAS domain-containing protein n=1 Tax=Ningiella ruwaisensis TaxID=2364274 RepID=UPI001445EA6B|nr:PAS domain-containing protein [Ningiella ruwaisensis]